MNKSFNDEWEALPEAYKTKFLQTLEERGLRTEFDLLTDENRLQIVEIIKQHVLGDMMDPGEESPD